MDHALPVSRGDSPGDLQRKAEGLSLGNRRRGEAGAEGFPFQQLRNRVGDAALNSEVEDRKNVRVRKRRHGQRLPLEARLELPILRDRGRENLDGHVAAQLRVPRPVDLTHAPGADPGHDPVRPQALACRECHQMFVAATLSTGGGASPDSAGTASSTLRRFARPPAGKTA